MFTDVCVSYKEIQTVDDQVVLNDGLKNCSKCKDWQMAINVEKTVCMTVTRKKNHLFFSVPNPAKSTTKDERTQAHRYHYFF